MNILIGRYFTYRLLTCPRNIANILGFNKTNFTNTSFLTNNTYLEMNVSELNLPCRKENYIVSYCACPIDMLGSSCEIRRKFKSYSSFVYIYNKSTKGLFYTYINLPMTIYIDRNIFVFIYRVTSLLYYNMLYLYKSSYEYIDRYMFVFIDY